MAARITPEKLATIERMFDDGASQTEIVRTLHVGFFTLRRYFPGRGMSQSEGGRKGLMLRDFYRLERASISPQGVPC